MGKENTDIKKVFKISDLPKIDIKDIDSKDLFVVTDVDERTEGKITKSLTTENLMKYIRQVEIDPRLEILDAGGAE